MKKTVSLLLSVLCICVALSACGSRELTDGTYRMGVTLTGGSGRASVESPAKVVIHDGTATATIVWSSSFYEYMLINDVRYEPIQESGNATFEIPVVLDQDMKVSACTVAMSQPHVVDYVLHFDSTTAKGE